MLTVKYKKIGAAVYISHIDIYRAIYRGIRRANLNVAYSRGFNPHAELYLSPPLPLFVYGACEYFTADTDEDADVFFARYAAAAHALLPPVNVFYTVKNPNLAGKIFSADYVFEMRKPDAEHGFLNAREKRSNKQDLSAKRGEQDPADGFDSRNASAKYDKPYASAGPDTRNIMAETVERLLSAEHIPYVNRNGKEKDARPYIYSAAPANNAINAGFAFANIHTADNAIKTDLSFTNISAVNGTVKSGIDSANPRAAAFNKTEFVPAITNTADRAINAGLNAANIYTVSNAIKINIDSVNLRADVVADELKKLSGVPVLAVTKTAQYVKTADGIIDADEYLRSSN
ncbi:MAG: TIGR03936 family radical SAM-associated protein [Clostridiales bacterium]|jgi:radical SAM-linked protein|nr:TIGR03936 family radical SAM-associated protein [Clostridiales bacterium]